MVCGWRCRGGVDKLKIGYVLRHHDVRYVVASELILCDTSSRK